MASIKTTEKSQSRGALEIGRAPRHSQQHFLVQKREPNLRGAQLAAQVNTRVEEDTGTDMLMLVCHTMKTNCNYRSVVCGVFRGSWGGVVWWQQSPSKHTVQYHHFTLRPGTWLTIDITYSHKLWKLPSLVIASNKTKLPLKGPREHGAGQRGDRRVWPPRHLSVSAKSQDMWRFSMQFQLKIFARCHWLWGKVCITARLQHKQLLGTSDSYHDTFAITFEHSTCSKAAQIPEWRKL